MLACSAGRNRGNGNLDDTELEHKATVSDPGSVLDIKINVEYRLTSSFVFNISCKCNHQVHRGLVYTDLSGPIRFVHYQCSHLLTAGARRLYIVGGFQIEI